MPDRVNPFSAVLTRAKIGSYVALFLQFAVMAAGFLMILHQISVNRGIGNELRVDVASRNAQFDDVVKLLEREIQLTHDNRARLDALLSRREVAEEK